MNNRVTKFQRGSAVFVCDTCKRRTRITDNSQPDKTCFECYELAGLDNMVADGEYKANDPEYGNVVRDSLLANIVRLGGDESRVKRDFKDLFAQ